MTKTTGGPKFETAGRTVTSRKNRTYSAHHLLLDTAQKSFRTISVPKGSLPENWKNQVLVSIVISAFSIEAFSNAVGVKLLPTWNETHECWKPLEKLGALCAAKSVPFNPQGELWASARWLFSMRNKIAHAKPESIVLERVLTVDEHHGEQMRKPFAMHPTSKLESLLTVSNARRAVSTAEAVQRVVCSTLSTEEKFGVTSDSWTTSVVLNTVSPASVAALEQAIMRSGTKP